MCRPVIVSLLLLIVACTRAQTPQHSRAVKPAADPARQKWVDSVYNRLNEDERIGQLFMVAAYSGGPNQNIPHIEKLLRAHQIGGLIFMQGGPKRQAILTNRYQQMAQVPLLLAMDAEWGLGMRLDSVIDLPKQMTLGAANDTVLAYGMGMAVAWQFKRLGVHVNFAPVVDVNNNPANPVINARSFGEDKRRVSRLGIAYMQGMQDYGIMACAKHFPGHGDVSVDSHLDLPVINKSKAALDSLELYPFREMIGAGVQSMMIAHLAVPALESQPRVPTTLSKNTVTGLLKREMGFNGLIFTDALDMKGVAKYYEPGEVDVRAFIAGNDVLLFSQDVPTAIAKIKAAIKSGKASTAQLQASVKKILAAKYDAGLTRFQAIRTNNITEDINTYTAELNGQVADAAITLVRDRANLVPVGGRGRVLCITIGGKENADLANALKSRAKQSFVSYHVAKGASTAAAEAAMNSKEWDAIVIAVQGLSFYPGRSYGLDDAAIRFLEKAAAKPNVIAAVMGNAYALKYVCSAGTLICGYEDNEWTAAALTRLLNGELDATGTLPVTPPCIITDRRD
jgi:beta-glucosidase-like glycosyl hydrolase